MKKFYTGFILGETDEQRKLIEEAKAFDHLMLKIMLGVGFFSFFGFNLIPISKSIIGFLIFGDEFAYEIPFKASFFYEITSVCPYIVTYILQSYYSYLAGALNVSEYEII